ncbi:MAG: indole-3-glycerol phosphate synthase TrpC [Duncaniella sp.]|nr:indole-3-glycerol phosphate synthase TrpC [Muribaculum sp.]MCM1256154.1 indole-3-glycerol phosphate synthase TrpC [Duncaniella sp.]
MSNILDKIVANKHLEVEAKIALLGKKLPFKPQHSPISMSKALLDSPTGIIAEFKRRSPSKGEIHPLALPAEIVPAYEETGAAACSVLTDTVYFGGSLNDLAVARKVANLPLLRKDFIVSTFQIDEARLYGADAILLIAAALTSKQVEQFTRYAHDLGLEVLFEIHNEAELEKFCPEIDMVGVNNRDLTTFITDPGLSLRIVSKLPDNVVKVAESGLSSIDEVENLHQIGYRGFLIGETFMKHDKPGAALKNFLE